MLLKDISIIKSKKTSIVFVLNFVKNDCKFCKNYIFVQLLIWSIEFENNLNEINNH